MKPRSTIAFFVVWLAWLFFRSPLWMSDPTLLALCAVMAVLTLYPLWRWTGGEMMTFPLVAAYTLMHIPAYLVPFLQARSDVIGYSLSVSFTSALAVCVYLLTLQLVARWSESAPWGSVRLNWPLLNRIVPGVAESTLMWFLLGIWWAFTTVITTGYLPNVGPNLQVVRVLCITPGQLAMFYLFFQYGGRKLSRWQEITLLGLVASGLALDLTGGYLIGVASNVLLILLAYIMGAKRVPLGPSMGCLALLAFLHMGKAEMRGKYWDLQGGVNYSTSRLNPVAVGAFWCEASWKSLLNGPSLGGDSSQSLLDRGSLAHVLTLVISETPQKKPYLNGQTYRQVPLLFVPRALMKNKPRGNLPTDTVALYYGLQTQESLATTSIAIGEIAEAWANFGWFGILVVGAFVGLIFSLPSHLASGRSVQEIGFLVGVVFLSGSYNLELTIGPWMVSLVNSLLVVTVGLYMISRPDATNRSGKNTAQVKSSPPKRSQPGIASR